MNNKQKEGTVGYYTISLCIYTINVLISDTFPWEEYGSKWPFV